MADLTSILFHIGGSIDPLERIISGGCYLIGILLLWTAIKKLKTVADARARYGGGGRMFIPLAYIMGGFVMFYLPTFIAIASNTLFGSGSPMEYASWLAQFKEKYGDGTYVMIRLIKLAGIIWFIRGTMLLVQASEPGVQHGPKGMAFLVGGVFAMNINHTINAISYIEKAFLRFTL